MAINLSKGQGVSLVKQDGSALTKIRLGLGWDAAPRKGLFGKLSGGGEIDLDASAILFDRGGNKVDQVFFGQLDSNDRSIHHTGDNLTGDGDGDDEQIVINLASVSPSVANIVFVITSYSGQRFSQVENVFARVVDLSGRETEVVRYDLREQGEHTAKVIAKLSREGSGWKFTAVGNAANGRTYKDVIADAQRVL